MGVEKNGSEPRVTKTNSMDLYRPPPLRNHNYNNSNDTVDTVTASFAKTGSVNATAAAVPSADKSCTSTTKATKTKMPATIRKTTLLSPTSISCNNSPTHANENNSFDNNGVTSRYVNYGKCTSLTTAPTTTTTTNALSINSESLANGAMPTTPVMTSANSSSSGVQQSQTSAVRRERRPDRAVYIPRARRSQTTPPTTNVDVLGIQQHENQLSNTTSLAPMPPTTAEATASVRKTASTKLDEISGQRATNSAANIIGKKIRSSTLNSRERREHSKKSNTSVELQEAKITKLSSEKGGETKSHQQQQNGHDLIALTNNMDVNNKETLYSTQQQQQRLTSDNTQRTLLYFERQTSEEKQVTYSTIDHNEMNTNSSKRNRVKNNSSHSGKNTNKVQNLRIEDVTSNENCTRSTCNKCDIEAQEFQRASKEINRSNRRIIKQTFISDVLEIPEKYEPGTENDIDTRQRGSVNALSAPASTLNRSIIDSTTEEEEEEDDWENMFDDSGECIDPKIMNELTASVGKVKIELPRMDYTAYLTKQSILNDEEFPHVLEVSNFPVEFKNHDLLMLFSQYKESGFDIKWVDDTHALAVFSSSRIAAEVLAMGHPFVALKPLAEATIESRLKAKKCAASLQPYRQRPETCAALARRLVTGALGVRLKTAAAEREIEKRVLREAKERKMLAAKQRDEIWES
ncbi:probable serine/threonine-protein kinase nek3 isoform X2 [Eurosta solidaginis]|uniref:probable serine/threonine-protein kinase nek3 isoform X2 n=1 Tax=Eurosta solidaginis TaxID=178769 RepID=UPI00353070AE